MTATKSQHRTINDILETETLMRWDGIFGFYSNGQCVISIWWDFDSTKQKFNIIIDSDGNSSHNPVKFIG